jgi:hypothetical protein
MPLGTSDVEAGRGVTGADSAGTSSLVAAGGIVPRMLAHRLSAGPWAVPGITQMTTVRACSKRTDGLPGPGRIVRKAGRTNRSKHAPGQTTVVQRFRLFSGRFGQRGGTGVFSRTARATSAIAALTASSRKRCISRLAPATIECRWLVRSRAAPAWTSSRTALGPPPRYRAGRGVQPNPARERRPRWPGRAGAWAMTGFIPLRKELGPALEQKSGIPTDD